jgi:hypothetical protein
MSDMNAFEQQLTAGFKGLMGPSEPVDDAAIFTAITATQSPKWRFQSMFSATKFVVAGAIVALFGGFLLAGMLTQPSDEQEPAAVTDSPGPTDLLPGVDLVTEEVEPGVYRVLSDGTDNDDLDLDFDSGTQVSRQVITGPDGSIWVRDGSLLIRLGSGGHLGLWGLEPYSPDISIAPDGRVWAISNGGEVWSSDGGEWTPHPRTPYVNTNGIEVAPDGSVWAIWSRGGRLGVDRLLDGEWQEDIAGLPAPGGHEQLAVGPDGTVLLGVPSWGAWGAGGWIGIMERHEDGWSPSITIDQATTDEEFGGAVGPIAFGPDGIAWAYSQASTWDGEWPPLYLHRRTDDGWETFGGDGSIPVLVSYQSFGATLAVSDDGRLWVAFDDPLDGGRQFVPGSPDGDDPYGNSIDSLEGSGCPGVISFDGEAWAQHLAGACVTHVSAAPDGTVWVVVAEGDGAEEWAAGMRGWSLDPDRPSDGLYVITPEAVEATE